MILSKLSIASFNVILIGFSRFSISFRIQLFCPLFDKFFKFDVFKNLDYKTYYLSSFVETQLLQTYIHLYQLINYWVTSSIAFICHFGLKGGMFDGLYFYRIKPSINNELYSNLRKSLHLGQVVSEQKITIRLTMKNIH